jgi:hypothetical protein
MQKYSALKNVLPNALINELHDKAMQTTETLRLTYFPEMSMRETLEKYKHSTPSRFSRAVAYRMMDSETIRTLKPLIEVAASSFWGQKEYLFYPVYYVRLSPGRSSGSHLLDSQPHYDKSFGCHAYSFWIPLQVSNRETGGICLYPDTDVAAEYVRRNENNRNDFNSYRENSAELDPVLQDNATTYDLEPGDVVTFDSDMLHGATRPGTKDRISFDIRLLSLSEQPKEACSPDLITLFNEHIDVSNALNLMALGDKMGARDILAKMDQDDLPQDIRDILQTFSSRTDLPSPDNLFEISPWQSEYAWYHALQA